jgi:hypothetical protein
MFLFMKDMFTKKNMIIGGIVVALVGAAMFFMSDTPSEDTSSVLITGSASRSEEERDILRLLSDLRTIEFERDVLESAVFLSLQDFSTPIIEGVKGRRNPFAPVGEGEMLSFPVNTGQ